MQIPHQRMQVQRALQAQRQLRTGAQLSRQHPLRRPAGQIGPALDARLHIHLGAQRGISGDLGAHRAHAVAGHKDTHIAVDVQQQPRHCRQAHRRADVQLGGDCRIGGEHAAGGHAVKPPGADGPLRVDLRRAAKAQVGHGHRKRRHMHALAWHDVGRFAQRWIEERHLGGGPDLAHRGDVTVGRGDDLGAAGEPGVEVVIQHTPAGDAARPPHAGRCGSRTGGPPGCPGCGCRSGGDRRQRRAERRRASACGGPRRIDAAACGGARRLQIGHVQAQLAAQRGGAAEAHRAADVQHALAEHRIHRAVEAAHARLHAGRAEHVAVLVAVDAQRGVPQALHLQRGARLEAPAQIGDAEVAAAVEGVVQPEAKAGKLVAQHAALQRVDDGGQAHRLQPAPAQQAQHRLGGQPGIALHRAGHDARHRHGQHRALDAARHHAHAQPRLGAVARVAGARAHLAEQAGVVQIDRPTRSGPVGVDGFQVAARVAPDANAALGHLAVAHAHHQSGVSGGVDGRGQRGRRLEARVAAQLDNFGVHHCGGRGARAAAGAASGARAARATGRWRVEAAAGAAATGGAAARRPRAVARKQAAV